MAKTGFADGPPVRAGITIADHASADVRRAGGARRAAAARRDRHGATGRRRDARRACAHNPSIIYCSISGYGQTGPNVDRPVTTSTTRRSPARSCHDAGEEPAIPARPDRRPRRRNRRRVLHLRGVGAERLQTGEGERIDVAMADVVASWSGTSSGNTFAGPGPAGRRVDRLRRVPCADGKWLTLAVISEDHFWKAVCDGLDIERAGRRSRTSTASTASKSARRRSPPRAPRLPRRCRGRSADARRARRSRPCSRPQRWASTRSSASGA